MKRWTLSLILVLGLLCPAYAEDKSQGEKGAVAEKVTPSKEKASPIPRLAELRPTQPRAAEATPWRSAAWWRCSQPVSQSASVE